MCFYITATLPKNTDIESVRDNLNRYNMGFSPIDNSTLSSQLRSGELLFRATKDYCDCDTSLGFLNRENEYQKLLNSKKVKTLRKKKWTQSQIDEWIKEKLRKKPPHNKRSITENERQLDAERWSNFIQEILKKVKRIGVLKHWYSASLEDEEVSIKRTERISLQDLNNNYLLNLEEDVLYEFFPHF
jgi:hypothetical protein